ncbi:hypothetical protein HDU91_004582, partial [Kappamyces sp. JEL0680]
MQSKRSMEPLPSSSTAKRPKHQDERRGFQQPAGVFKPVAAPGQDDDEGFNEDLEPRRRRKGGVKDDVYESDEDAVGPDSDDDTEDEQEKTPAKKDQEDDDMFGEDAPAADRPRKKSDFIKAADVE